MDVTQLINESGIIGGLLNNYNTYVSGSWTLTFVGVLFLFLAIGLMFKMPPELILLLITPLVLLFMAFDSGFMIFGAVILIFIGLYFGLNWIIK